MAALITCFDVPAERGGPAQFDRRHDAALGGRQRGIMLCAIGSAVAAEYVPPLPTPSGHCRSNQKYCGLAGDRVGAGRGKSSKGLDRGADLVGGDPQVMGGGREAAVTEQQFNGAHVGAGLQQMDGEGVPQAVRRDRFGQAGASRAFAQACPTASLVIGWPARSPGKSHAFGRRFQ
ncbi:hypothetical protein X737_27440 [Mesorhizobium sp. L48C026A00]|nr:hypothetical protein X737_27440 [Mesorhizobium sp. L48C026A00]